MALVNKFAFLSATSAGKVLLRMIFAGKMQKISAQRKPPDRAMKMLVQPSGGSENGNRALVQ